MSCNNILAAIAVCIGLLLSHACENHSKRYFRANYKDANSLLHQQGKLQEKPFLKAHARNGDVLIMFGDWQLDTTSNLLSGDGIRYDFNRAKLEDGPLKINIDSVLIFETNQKIVKPEEGRIAALAIIAGLDVVLGFVCLINPKACFGSCPTFYLDPSGDVHTADAEGFSNAIAPSLAYADIDAIGVNKSQSGNIAITMKNEALETHCVEGLSLLACPVSDGQQVLHTRDDRFYLATDLMEPFLAEAPEGDILPLVRHNDKLERYSLASNENMVSTEEIILEFEKTNHAENLGLVVHFRQTLMTTYMIYSAMGYMGDEVSDVFAKIESGEYDRHRLGNNLYATLGALEVYSWDESQSGWAYEGSLYETGPIAINKQMVTLNARAQDAGLKLKLVMNKGLWRIDYLALAELQEEVFPFELKPVAAMKNNNVCSRSLAEINKAGVHLISLPGDEFRFDFALPQGQDHALFIRSSGYYLQWMREGWLKDKDMAKLWKMINTPEAFLRNEARSYKNYEATMEEAFWDSRIDTKTFSIYETALY